MAFSIKNFVNALYRQSEEDITLENWEEKLEIYDLHEFKSLKKEADRIKHLTKTANKLDSILIMQDEKKKHLTKIEEGKGFANFMRRLMKRDLHKARKQAIEMKEKITKKQIKEIILLLEDLKEMEYKSQKISQLAAKLIPHQEKLRELAYKENINIEMESEEASA